MARRSAGSASPYGTFDQGGNLWELNETIAYAPSNRGLRGGSYAHGSGSLASSARDDSDPTDEYYFQGFRVAAVIPEPGTALLIGLGLAGLAAARRRRSLH